MFRQEMAGRALTFLRQAPHTDRMTLPPETEAHFARQTPDIRAALTRLRDLIVSEAARHPEIGDLTEKLKWGQPSFVPARPRTGTPVRIDADSDHNGDIAFYVSCQTSLVAGWRERYPALSYGKMRSVHLGAAGPWPEAELRHMIAEALTYHLRLGRRG